MEVSIVAQGAGRDHKIFLVLIGEILERLVFVRIDDGALFKPADFVLLCLDLQEPASVLEDFKRLTVCDLAYAVGNGSDAVVQVHLARSNVDHLSLVFSQMLAARCKEEREHQKQGRKPGHVVPKTSDEQV